MEFKSVKSTDPLIPHSLLIEADPNESAVKAYLSRSRILLGIEGGRVLGAAVYEITHEEACLWNICVCKTHRRKGLGAELIDEMSTLVRLEGIKSLLVGTGNSSLGPLAFYQRCGFRMDSIRKGFFESYHPPIYENSIRCIDMLMLRKYL